jgi:predicted DNA-binding mobile mystery protein A
MKDAFRDLQLHQLDASLASWRSAQLSPRPRTGWVRAIREALGMSGAAFARRLGISQAGVRKLESSESSDAITLATLRKLAGALDCELHYALVPRKPLAQALHDRAQELAKAQMLPVSHSMALEDQTVDEPVSKLQLELAVAQLLKGSRRALW